MPESVISAIAGRPWERVVVREGFNDAAMKAAMDEVIASAEGGAVRKTLVFPPGDFHLTKPLFTSTATNDDQLQGLSVEGQGIRATRIFWDNAGADAPGNPLANNLITAVRRLRWATIGGFSVISNGAKNRFAYLLSDTQGFNQAWHVHDVEFSGPWDRVFGIDGDQDANLNSEMSLRRLFTATNSTFRDAFFRTGGISGTYPQQNQFLNYWVEDCCLTLSSGVVFRLDRGGSLRVSRGSWSAATADGTITWFLMPNGQSNSRTAAQLSVRDVRFEPKGDRHKIIDCSWGTGTVTFDDCSDVGSMQNTASYARTLHRYVGQPWWDQGNGPTVRYRSCALAGRHEYDGPRQTRGGFVYDGSHFYRGQSGQTTTPADVLRSTDGAARYRFINCDNIADASNR
ncbi:hypothetical protein [Streptomyces sp. NPDC047108]|uniref:hypothetical protein n=1 Tax=Streptomyces sp. NPDC047108 TaxID=3155025 RepID=UPI00340CE397